MGDPIKLPYRVLAYYDDYWCDIEDYLREEGELGEEENLTSLELDITVEEEEEVEIADFESEPMP